jgi:selenocysteine lyase/cysteine desulfurase
VHRRAFYLAGGYKYAMSGEGACFLAVPPGNRLRPVDTGWYAAFDRLAQGEAEVPYADGAFRFWGATFDASGLYRFVAAMDWLDRERITVEAIHRHATVLQKHFLDGCARRGVAQLAPSRLVPPPGAPRGNFLAFALPDAGEVHRRIVERNVTIDRRGDRVRFGFGLYHDEAEVERLVEVVAQALR